MSEISDLQKKIDDLASEFGLPSITTWKQGKFIDSSKYQHWTEREKFDAEQREEALIRPAGGTNDALFRVEGISSPDVITEFLESLGKLIADGGKGW